jgi:hypothetical protein
VLGDSFDRLMHFTASGQRLDNEETNIRHSRQDLRLIAWLLAAVLIVLGIIADCLY